MREIETHKTNGCNEAIKIEVLDEPGGGGANHSYSLSGFDTEENPGAIDSHEYGSSFSRLSIIFQNGPIGEVGTNGVTHEALLAILIDRFQAFQRGPYACRENAIALTHLEDAMHWLKHRTEARTRRGVEGTHAK